MGGGRVEFGKVIEKRQTENKSNKHIKNIIYNNFQSNDTLQEID